MSMQRITVSLPQYLYESLVEQVSTGKVSDFVAQAIARQLITFSDDPIDEFIKLRKELPKKKKLEIIKAIKKGRI